MGFSASWVQRQLAQRLMELHTASGMPTEDVAKQVGIDRSTLQRIQQAKMRATPRIVGKLCRVYQVSDEETGRLCEMAVASRIDAWWEPYRPWLSVPYAEYVGYENEASLCRSVHPTMVHGLLQTPEYMRVVITEGNLPMSPDQIDALVDVRALRQRRLVEPTPLRLEAFLGEPTLHWRFGGAAVLRAQLVHLRAMVELPNVHVRIVPFVRPYDLFPLDYLAFEEGGPAVAFTETQFGVNCHDSDHEIRHAVRTIERTASLALSEKESAVLIDRRIKELEQL